MSTDQQLKARIMRRIYAIWFWRRAAPMLGVEAVLVVGVLVGVLSHISIPNILANAFHASADIGAFIKFFISNFFVKSAQSQLLVAAWGALIGFFIRDFVAAFRKIRGSGVGIAAMFSRQLS